MSAIIYIVSGIAILALLCGSVIAASHHSHYAFDIDVMLEALRQVENWDGRSRGADGERGPWQITPAVWCKYSDKPFAWADGRSFDARIEQRRVAREHVYDITLWLESEKTNPTPFRVALVYCAGWSAYAHAIPHKPSKAKRDYARRATNIYSELIKSNHTTEENESR